VDSSRFAGAWPWRRTREGEPFQTGIAFSAIAVQCHQIYFVIRFARPSPIPYEELRLAANRQERPNPVTGAAKKCTPDSSCSHHLASPAP